MTNPTTPMFASIRKYTGAPQLAEELGKRKEELQAVLQPLAGFFAHYILKLSDGIVSMTVCAQRAGADESAKAESAWLKDKLPTFANRAPELMAGELVLHLTAPVPVPVKVTA